MGPETQARLATEQAERVGAASSSRGASDDGRRASSAATSVQARWRGGAARQAQRDAVAAELEHMLAAADQARSPEASADEALDDTVSDIDSEGSDEYLTSGYNERDGERHRD